MDTQKDEKLWRLAKRRVQFKKSLTTYIVVNFFLWVLWWITLGRYAGFNLSTWPIYVTLGWGIGITFQYLNAYGPDSSNLVEKEYEKLKNQSQS